MEARWKSRGLCFGLRRSWKPPGRIGSRHCRMPRWRQKFCAVSRFEKIWCCDTEKGTKEGEATEIPLSELDKLTGFVGENLKEKLLEEIELLDGASAVRIPLSL